MAEEGRVCAWIDVTSDINTTAIWILWIIMLDLPGGETVNYPGTPQASVAPPRHRRHGLLFLARTKPPAQARTGSPRADCSGKTRSLPGTGPAAWNWED